jgi:chromate transport protein ChrA
MLFTVRYVLPGVLVLAGLACLIVVSGDTAFEGWALFTAAGLSVLLFNVLIRIGEDGDRDRQAEDAARAYFDAHGRWPDE